jgi:excisionase family DNA binding protein
MNDKRQPLMSIEPMIDATEAALALNLPRYYFARPALRRTLGIPFYRFGRSIRFRPSELEQWARRYHSRNGEHA